jgi:hypothetical protein
MKLFFKMPFVILSFILILYGCKKDPPINPAKDITGQWQWIFSYTVQLNPLTPQNTGIQEVIKFNSNYSWLKIQNNIQIDSGTFTKGHGNYIPYPGAHTFIYNSIVYYRNGISEKGIQDYYKIFNDTLEFCAGFAGYSTKSDPSAGASEFYIKQK